MEANLQWLDDPQVFRVNQLPAHSDHSWYATKQEVTEGSSLSQSLNGLWDFYYAQNYRTYPTGFEQPDFALTDFTQITVPQHIEMAGFNKLHYINTMYPWEGHEFRRPPFTSQNQVTLFAQALDNHIGCYRKEFTLKQSWRTKNVLIRFEGVEQAFYLWLNGHFIGYAEDSFTPSEFDLTSYLNYDGANHLAVAVYQRSTAAYLEDQDFFRFFGIFRNVSLLAFGQNHLADLWLKPTVNSDYRSGRLSAQLKFDNITPNAVVKASVLTPAGQLLTQLTQGLAKETTLDFGEFSDILLWDHYQPNLYKLQLEMLTADQTLCEYSEYDFGFREICLKDKVMYLNGKRLIINGVNRHEWHPAKGRAIDLADMQADLETIKQANINGVRTSHYPNQIPWYFLCDQAGIHLMAETNLETHGTWQKPVGIEPSYNVPGNISQWFGAVLDRAKTNFETFKNHPSILFWSLGNESYAQEGLRLMNEYFKQVDPSRLVHYEGNFNNPEFEDCISDIKSCMYAHPAAIEEYLTTKAKKPFILCEYMHDMGNSLGGMNDYMQLLDKYEMYQGGYIWDFKDQAIFVKDEITGQDVLRYGGDFDDRPSDYEFSGNGIVFADGQAKPAMQEVKYYYGKYRNY